MLAALVTIVGGCGGNNEAGSGTLSSSTAPEQASGKPVELTFYYPIQVGGALTATIESMAEQFTEENPGIIVKPVYTGSYGDTTLKTQAAVAGGNPPDVAVLLAADLFSFMDMDSIMPLNDFIAKDGGNDFLDDFYPAFMENSQLDGKTYSLPFQRSNVLLYYNKDAFKDAGLDPEKPPTTWDELAQMAKQLTKDGRWGIEIPSSAPTSSTWMFSAFAIQSGKNLMSQDGKEVYFDTPENVAALQYWVDLSKKTRPCRKMSSNGRRRLPTFWSRRRP